MMTGSGAVRGFDFSSLAEEGGRFSTVVCIFHVYTLLRVVILPSHSFQQALVANYTS